MLFLSIDIETKFLAKNKIKQNQRNARQNDRQNTFEQCPLLAVD